MSRLLIVAYLMFAASAASGIASADSQGSTEIQDGAMVFAQLREMAGKPDMLLLAQAEDDSATEGKVTGRVQIVPADEDIIRYDQPIAVGPFPVRGKSIAQLIEGVPLFPPIEGLDKSLWEKTCSNCHQWNKERLCDQGKTYVGLNNTRLVLRHSHPYGGPFKLALMRWAEKGCL